MCFFFGGGGRKADHVMLSCDLFCECRALEGVKRIRRTFKLINPWHAVLCHVALKSESTQQQQQVQQQQQQYLQVHRCVVPMLGGFYW